ncbi:MAG: carbamoyltransferase HypF [Anoxybacillus sp.]|nr:carbamoyltransferase HypF [Anoxybacillus sp.]MCL6585991.1 carbamoyltransferase HypF [Anoxybacillus sp.]
MAKAIKVTVRGRVQGVGFRPFVFQLAHRYRLAGTVQNNMDGVTIIAEGEEKQLHLFLHALIQEAPRLSRIDEWNVVAIPAQGWQQFSIIKSERKGTSSLVIPIDTAVCDDCLQEMNDPADFRYCYPFINCTQCGPRYTIIEQLPYDRPYTSMKTFPMCNRCQKEYENPLNRRHHAQPIACPTCGPSVMLIDRHGQTWKEEAIEKAQEFLMAGAIVAIKGLGGYHLACDATNETAVRQLRKRKQRPTRPLAIMAANLAVANQIGEINEKEAQLLTSPEAPIVIVKRKPFTLLAPSISPRLTTVGVMLPYTPLHHLLLDEQTLPLLVMTSANRSGMPILYEDAQAFSELNEIADYFLVHNRSIVHPLDDSVVQWQNGRLDFLRRARGFVPDPLFTTESVHALAALGGQQKNVFAFGRNQQLFLGPHIGDLQNIDVIHHFLREYEHLRTWLGIQPDAVAVDMHPNYETWNIVKEWDVSVIPVQHHHAHMVACMEDNGLKESCFGLILDGTGYGEDGNVWGFELLYGDASYYERLGHLLYTPLPGGEKCIKEPWRTAVGMLGYYFGEKGYEYALQRFPDKQYEIAILKNMIEKGINAPLAGTCGRLFDAVSAFLHVCLHPMYDGEAAIRLSEIIDEENVYEPYPFAIRENRLLEIDLADMWLAIIEDVSRNENPVQMAGRFHETVVAASVEMIRRAAKRHRSPERRIVLSGGSMHNRYVTKRLVEQLQAAAFTVYTHQKVPCSDGGLALGQLMIAAKRREREVCASEFQQK